MALWLISKSSSKFNAYCNYTYKISALSSLCLQESEYEGKVFACQKILNSDFHDFKNTIEPSKTTIVTSITKVMAPYTLLVELRTRFCLYSKLWSLEVSKRGRVFPNVELEPWKSVQVRPEYPNTDLAIHIEWRIGLPWSHMNSSGAFFKRTHPWGHKNEALLVKVCVWLDF